MSDKNQEKNKFSTLKGINRVVPIILISAAALITVLLIFGEGALGGGIKGLLKGMFGFGAYVIPLSLLIHGLCLPEDLEHKSVLRRAIFSAVALVIVSSIDYAVFSINNGVAFSPAEAFINMNCGGVIGNLVGFLLSICFGSIGAIIVLVGILAIYATFFYAEKAGSLGQAALRIKRGAKKTVDGIKEKRHAAIEKKKQIKDEEDRQKYEAASEELMKDDFFTADSTVKVKKLGIDEEASPGGASSLNPKFQHVEEAPSYEDKPERKRRSADKPLDLSYGLENTSSSDNPSKKEEFGNAFFGIDDSADNVFTKDFDPFNFATGEKTAAKYASKVSTINAGVEEELDEFTIYEMKANHIPSEREKRLMELERRKREWLYERQKREAKANGVKEEASVKVDSVSLFDSVIDPAVKKAPAYATSAAAFGAAFDRRPPDPQPAPSTPREVQEKAVSTDKEQVLEAPATSVDNTAGPENDSTPIAPASATVNAYSSYANTKTTYHQPIKTVEFTITKEPKPEPVSTKPAIQKAEGVNTEESSEDVAIMISERIARQTPGYARSANDLKTYTKVVASAEDDELYRQLNGGTSSVTATAEAEDTAIPETINPTPEVVEFEEVEERLPETVEFSVGEVDETPNVAIESSYQRAAGFAASMVNQANASTFKPYSTPTVTSSINEDNEKEEITLKVERSMLSPTPEAAKTNSTPVETEPASVEFEPLFDVAEESDSSSNTDDHTVMPEVDFLENEIEESVTTEIPPEEENVSEGEIPPEKQNPDVIKMREMFPFLSHIDEQQKEMAKSDKEAPVDAPPFEIDTEQKAEPVKDFVEPTQKSQPTMPVPVDDKKPQKKNKPDYSDYKFPSIELLAKEESLYDDNIQAEIQENADKLIETLASFGVTASIKGVDRGPRITRYEVVPAKGVKVSQILNLQDDIALSLAAGSIRMEAPIPGKSAVGIEIPNKKPSIVRLRDLLETAEFQSSKSKTFTCIGRDVAGQPVFGDLAKMPHLLIAGATGMGKSVCINSLLISILYKARPDEVKLIMIDPKQVEFTMYNGIPHLLVPVVSDPKQAAGSLMWAVEEMERRFDLLKPLCVRNIDAYNEKIALDPSLGEPMSKIIIVIDEFADLMLQVKDPVEALVMRIAQKARAAGIHLVIGTQRPSVNVITGVIKANVPSRISCKVMSNVDSKTVLDSGGAEKLLDKGDSLYAPAGSPKPHRVQCAFVADGEVEAIMAYLQQFSDGSNYDSEVMADIERAAQKCSKKGSDRDRDDDDGNDGGGEGYLNDRQFLDAVEVAVNTRKISTSLIQRKLSIGYGKAAKFIDIMEDMGIVGEANGQRPREVLLTPDEWREKLARASLE